MTTAELHVVSYWRACQALRNPRLAPVDRAQVADALSDLATNARGRVARAAADRLARENSPFVEDAFDFSGFGPEAS